MRHLTHYYGQGESRVKALNDVSFSLGRGEIVLIVGSSGSGKSTLLNMIGLLDRPTRGDVIIDGVDASILNDGQLSAFRNRKLGFVFQFSNLLSDLTVLENVMLPSQMAGRASSARDEAVALLRSFGLGAHLNKRANKISGGQAQRAAIARGLINHPSLVLADEPTGNLDSVTAGTVVDLIKSTARRLSQTFVIVTHDRSQFGDVDRIIHIKDGSADEIKTAMGVVTR